MSTAELTNAQATKRRYQERHREVLNARRRERRKNSPEERTWTNMKTRCMVPSHASYPHYGGRGIEVRYESFQAFVADVGPKPGPEYTIDRIDPDGHYEPGNCRWATWSEQHLNKRHHKEKKE